MRENLKKAWIEWKNERITILYQLPLMVLSIYLLSKWFEEKTFIHFITWLWILMKFPEWKERLRLRPSLKTHIEIRWYSIVYAIFIAFFFTVVFVTN